MQGNMRIVVALRTEREWGVVIITLLLEEQTQSLKVSDGKEEGHLKSY